MKPLTPRGQEIMDSIDKVEKIREMVPLLIECRDALPAIKLTAAKLKGIDLTLADRIEDCLKPWEVPPDTEGAI